MLNASFVGVKMKIWLKLVKKNIKIKINNNNKVRINLEEIIRIITTIKVIILKKIRNKNISILIFLTIWIILNLKNKEMIKEISKKTIKIEMFKINQINLLKIKANKVTFKIKSNLDKGEEINWIKI